MCSGGKSGGGNACGAFSGACDGLKEGAFEHLNTSILGSVAKEKSKDDRWAGPTGDSRFSNQ